MTTKRPKPSDATVAGSANAPAGASAEPGADTMDNAITAAFEESLAESMRRADEAEAQAGENWDRYLRAEAELENQRRRAERLRDEAQARVRRELLGRVLEVADNLERALGAGDGNPAALLAGVQATHRDLLRFLEREGVAAIDAQDAPFDPSVHEAVGVVALPNADGERVVAVERPGYLLNGELLRPARVVVGQPA